MKRALALALGLLALACSGPHLPAAYVRDRDDAERAYGEGRFDDAAKLWLAAAKAAQAPRDRNEARYRAATSYERGGKVTEARTLYTELAAGNSERAPRSAFALADLQLAAGDTQGGYAALEAAVRKYPTSGVANLALRRYFAELAETGGNEAVLAYIAQVEPGLDHSALAEQLLYERAQRLNAAEKIAEARDAYVVVADRFPYPYGAYWDDALFHAAECEQKLGNSARAVALLERMLAAREESHLSGSYERPRFAEAAYRVAELYRDALNDPAAARRAFRNVYVAFPTSTLRDDALWQEALLARRASSAEACAPLSLLVRDIPDSRYVPCAARICPSLRLAQPRECRDYILRELGEQAPPSSAANE